ncbi:hypothetical protein COOONC_02519 [Cooperia oncophora]
MGLTSTGYSHVYHFTKYLGAYPIPDKKAETVAEALFSNWICGCGRWPAALLSDRGSEFENSLWELSKNSPRGTAPGKNGITEKANGTIVYGQGSGIKSQRNNIQDEDVLINKRCTTCGLAMSWQAVVSRS